ncbi:MAG: ribonuclease HII [Caldilineaceae bacterium]|nr:ribonuclease HII [Caldilineaceae bacterium]
MIDAPATPDLAHEVQLWHAGHRAVAGVDEAGRGALAGPVVAAAVILPCHALPAGVWAEVRDSKLLRPAVRVRLAAQVQAEAAAWAVGVVPAPLIDTIGIAAATRRAMADAIAALHPEPDALLVDWVRLPLVNLPQLCVAKADSRMVSVAAASILAKVTRDRLLAELDARYPDYGFAHHKGYGTRQHLAALAAVGPCAEHRHSFAPVMAAPRLFDGDEAPPP